jgi:hypothetical protein
LLGFLILFFFGLIIYIRTGCLCFALGPMMGREILVSVLFMSTHILTQRGVWQREVVAGGQK